jgi:hypothetical protein
MIKVESILKWKIEGSLLKKLKMVRAQILSKNSDAVAISDNDLHITLAAGTGWQKLRSRIKAKDIDEPEFSIDIDPTVKVIEKGGSKSWYVKLKNQQDWKEYVMDSLQGTYDSGRVYHISLANLTGNKEDSVAMVEDRDYKDEYKKFQSSKKMKKYRAELNQYNRRKGTYGNRDRKDASHKNGRIVGFEDESVNRGRAEKSRLPKTQIKESIKLGDQTMARQYFDKNFKDMKLAFSTHSKKDHLDREEVFNGAKLIRTFKKFLKKYKNKIPEIPRTPEDDIAQGADKHYIYDKESNYSILFVLKEGSPKDVFLVMTAYPNLPQIAGNMTKWEV